jgi:hypothetical protein
MIAGQVFDKVPAERGDLDDEEFIRHGKRGGVSSLVMTQ